MHGTVVGRMIPLLINVAVMALCLFGAAGRLNWGNAWGLIGLSFLTSVASSMAVARKAGLVAERHDVTRGEAWDKVMVGLTVLIGPVATWITAGLDLRHHWSASLPSGAVVAGVVAALGGGALLVWAMASNAFFSSVVRIQKDRGHTVVTAGPYRIVRHPGYAGAMLFLMGMPLILDARCAFLPAGLTAGLMVLRTVLEDRTLQRELEGYGAYAQTVRYKLAPLVW